MYRGTSCLALSAFFSCAARRHRGALPINATYLFGGDLSLGEISNQEEVRHIDSLRAVPPPSAQLSGPEQRHLLAVLDLVLQQLDDAHLAEVHEREVVLLDAGRRRKRQDACARSVATTSGALVQCVPSKISWTSFWTCVGRRHAQRKCAAHGRTLAGRSAKSGSGSLALPKLRHSVFCPTSGDWRGSTRIVARRDARYERG
jgi:hypothetical protein